MQRKEGALPTGSSSSLKMLHNWAACCAVRFCLLTRQSLAPTTRDKEGPYDRASFGRHVRGPFTYIHF